MRSSKSLTRLALAGVATLLLASPALAQNGGKPDPRPDARSDPRPDPRDEPSRTQQIGEGAGRVVSSPFKDVGVIREKIPQVLIDARKDTYALPSPLTCATIFDAVDALNEELAPDLDADSTRIKNGMSVTELGQTLVNGLMPMRTWVRKLSGAEKNANEVQAAILAGSVRRGYLKGVGLSRGCRPPAAPLNVTLPKPTPVKAKAKPKKR